MATKPQTTVGPTGPTGPIGPAADTAALQAQIDALDVRVTALEQETPQPLPDDDDIIWKDFVQDFGAPTDGSDCSAQWAQARTWMQSEDRPGLKLGPYTFNGVGFFSDNAVFDGAGATVSGMWIGEQGTMRMERAYSALFNSTYAGAVVLRIKDAADMTKFTVGAPVLITGLGLQGGPDLGYPPNNHNFEYHTITAIDGQSITLDAPLEFDYLDTWPAMQTPPSASDPNTWIGGPATIYALGPEWLNTVEIRNLTCTDPYSVYNGGNETVILDHVVFTGRGPSCSLTKNWINMDCDMGGRTDSAEIDKLTSHIIYDHCTGGGLWFQSTSITRATFQNGCKFDFIQGSPRQLMIDNSEIGSLTAGQAYGIADTLTVNDSIMHADPNVGWHFMNLDAYQYEQRPDGGVFKMKVTDNIGQMFPHPPGYQLAWGFYDGAWHIWPDDGQGGYLDPVTFLIKDIRLEDDPETGFIVLYTDIMEYPPTCRFWGTVPTQAFALPYKIINASNVTKPDGTPVDFSKLTVV